MTEKRDVRRPKLQFMAEIWETEAAFVDTTAYNSDRFHRESILDVWTHNKPRETFYEWICIRITHHALPKDYFSKKKYLSSYFWGTKKTLRLSE